MSVGIIIGMVNIGSMPGRTRAYMYIVECAWVMGESE